MRIAIDDGLDPAEVQVQRLEYRYRRAQNALAGARAHYGALRESMQATETQLHSARRQVEETQRYLTDLQIALETAEERAVRP